MGTAVGIGRLSVTREVRFRDEDWISGPHFGPGTSSGRETRLWFRAAIGCSIYTSTSRKQRGVSATNSKVGVTLLRRSPESKLPVAALVGASCHPGAFRGGGASREPSGCAFLRRADQFARGDSLVFRGTRVPFTVVSAATWAGVGAPGLFQWMGARPPGSSGPCVREVPTDALRWYPAIQGPGANHLRFLLLRLPSREGGCCVSVENPSPLRVFSMFTHQLLPVSRLLDLSDSRQILDDKPR